MVEPFLWASGGQKITPAQAKIMRELAAAKVARSGVPNNLGEGLASVGDALLYNSNMARASDAEREGQAAVAEALAAAQAAGTPEAYISVLGNDWASDSQRAIAQTLAGREFAADDRELEWGRQDALRGQDRGWQIEDRAYEEAKPDPMVNAGGGNIFDPNTNQWLSPPVDETAPLADFDDISGIRKEIHQLPSYKNLAQATPIYESMFETAGRSTRASDLNLVYGLGKIMDPTSVVREGEMFMVQGINTLPDKVVEGINSLLTGDSALSETTRQQLLQEAHSRMKSYEQAFASDAKSYEDIASRYRINPKDVLPSFEPSKPFEPPALPGDVPSVASDEEFDALPSGAIFIDPDGKKRRKP